MYDICGTVMEVVVIFHDRSSGRMKLGVMSSQTVGQKSEMMAKLPTAAVVKMSLKDDDRQPPVVEVAVGGAAVFYLSEGPMYQLQRDGYWDIYTEQTGHQFCLGEVRRPRTWAELVHVVRGLWATIPEREREYHREQDAMDMEAVMRTYPSDSESNADFTDDEEMEAALEERRAFPRRNSDVSDDEV